MVPLTYSNPSKINMCVNVLCANRPEYLYITLDAIYRNTFIPDVNVYIDKLPDGMNYNKELLDVISDFNVQQIIINKQNNNIGRQFWYALDNSFNIGYNFCVNIEDDWLVTTDALRWLYEVPKTTFAYSLYRWTRYLGIDPDGSNTVLRNGEYLSWCVAFPKDAFYFAYNIVKSGAWFGLFDKSLSKEVLDKIERIDWDILLMAIFRQYSLTQLVPPTSLLAHFGGKTSLFYKGGYEYPIDVHSCIVEGHKSQWIANVNELFVTWTDDQKMTANLMPVDFRYR